MLLQSSSLPPTLYNRIVKISKNATRMRNMISELLEFRKLEQNYVSLRVCEQNLVPFLKDIYLRIVNWLPNERFPLIFIMKKMMFCCGLIPINCKRSFIIFCPMLSNILNREVW